MALTIDWGDTLVKVIAGGAGTTGVTMWLRRRLGRESVLRKSFVAAMRTAFTESVSPELSMQMDDTRASIVDLTKAVSKLSNGQTELKTDVAMVKTDVANVGEKVTTFGERLAQHLEWEEKERKSDIAHRKRASVQRREQFAQITTRLDALDARMATVEHAQ